MTNRNNVSSTEGRNPDGAFAPGNSGRPQGARHKVTIAVEELLEGDAEALAHKATDLALEGDTTALWLCMERIAPPRKDAPVQVDLPEFSNESEAATAASAILKAVSDGSRSKWSHSYLSAA